ncbi:hypothetical protein [Corynebacterium pygosceleis]|uniref:hypothetical protein n=1 Tax=Corynebacterium pygosceleis TaxID=2800406 RepID=UPI0020054CCD|nr:hypothetical protein [Corynebacterium pygosceleis]MCK7676372.1 hypothetical protein [Corynebacterium pygosceleis]
MELVLTVDLWDEPATGGGYERHVRGERFEVDAVTGAWLVGCGAAVDPSAVPEPEPAPEPEPVVVEETPAPEPDTAPAGRERPKKTAPISEWRTYAESLGVKTSGMSKQEIQAATQ